jgi:hypothetical protein
VHLTSASRNYSRNLAVDIENARLTDVDSQLDLAHAGATLDASIEIVARALTGPKDLPYTRSSALFDQAEQTLEVSLERVEGTEFALRDFRLIDGTMASLAKLMGLRITDFDTVGMGGSHTIDGPPVPVNNASGTFGV